MKVLWHFANPLAIVKQNRLKKKQNKIKQKTKDKKQTE